ncbi:MAG: hypothetical protein MJZ03_05670 [archaeon]|jgi:hypothetical protein|nr:hypothetical protein [archaeon]
MAAKKKSDLFSCIHRDTDICVTGFDGKTTDCDFCNIYGQCSSCGRNVEGIICLKCIFGDEERKKKPGS